MNHKESNPISFHVPGHKNGNVFLNSAKSLFKDLLALDVTELNGLDDLHDPEEVIKEAQNLLASYYNAKKSYFLVNGTTVGNIAMLFATINTGELVLVQRNCHKSIINALTLIGATPIFITPQVDINTMTPTGLQHDDVIEALNTYSEAKALILTNPSYYGFAQDLTKIVESAHASQVPVLVDEAHGAHFGLGKPFPKSALQCNADIVVQSAHKTLPAMTMGSYLHINEKSLVDVEKVEYYLKIFQSSSPSYPIMASLDLARNYLQSLNENRINTIISSHSSFINKLKSLNKLKVISDCQESNYILDPLKVIIQASNKATGISLQKQLEKEGIFTELADSKNVLLILPLAEIKNQQEVISKISDALKGVKVPNREVRLNENFVFSRNRRVSKLAFSYKEMEKRKVVTMELAQSSGKIAAEVIIPYPPGIPVLMPGEVITSEKLTEIKNWKDSGVRIQGKSEFNNIKVFDD
jgi:arginine/lysine/ornithine decarboxylase